MSRQIKPPKLHAPKLPELRPHRGPSGEKPPSIAGRNAPRPPKPKRERKEKNPPRDDQQSGWRTIDGKPVWVGPGAPPEN